MSNCPSLSLFLCVCVCVSVYVYVCANAFVSWLTECSLHACFNPKMMRKMWDAGLRHTDTDLVFGLTSVLSGGVRNSIMRESWRKQRDSSLNTFSVGHLLVFGTRYMPPYVWVDFYLQVRTFCHQVCFYRSQLLRGQWRTHISIHHNRNKSYCFLKIQTFIFWGGVQLVQKESQTNRKVIKTCVNTHLHTPGVDLPLACTAELWEYPRATSAVSTSCVKGTSLRTNTNSARWLLWPSQSATVPASSCSTTQ